MRIKLTEKEAISILSNGGDVYFYYDVDGIFEKINTVDDLNSISLAFLPSEYWTEKIEK